MTKHTLQPDIEETENNVFEFDSSEYKQEPELTYTPPLPETPYMVNPESPDEGSDPDAPFGRNADGSPIAPYGFTKRGGKVKRLPGRPIESESKEKATTGAGDDSEKLLNDIADDKPKESEAVKHPEAKKEFKVYINGAMFLLALDFVFPGVISMAYNFFNDAKVDRSDLCMTEDERKEMQPLADEVVQELLKGLSPLQQFLIYTGVMYGTKLTFAPKKLPYEKKEKSKKEKVEKI